MIRCNKKHSEQELQQRRFRPTLELRALWSSTGEQASDSQTSPFTQQHSKHTNDNSITTHFTFKVDMRAELGLFIFLIRVILSYYSSFHNPGSNQLIQLRPTLHFFLFNKHFQLKICAKNGVLLKVNL